MDIEGWVAYHVVFHLIRFLGVHVFTRRTPIGRKVIASMSYEGRHARAGEAEVARRGRRGDRAPDRGVRDGTPVVEGGQVLDDVTNVVWSVGFRHDLSWIDLPIFGEDGAPMHERGVVTSEPGMYFMGLPFQFAAASDMIPGVSRDARYVVKQLLRRSRATVTPVTVAA